MSGRVTDDPQLKKELELKVNTLRVEKAELDHLKPDRAVYQRVGNVLFRTDKARVAKTVADKLNAATTQLDQLSGGGASGSGAQR
ncbi:hypothetical protein Rsub_00203 [Raphidocelis subcapitata]|uniref:Prefoldin subunit n=1 Tax=Raphidocelis subcapitata TaxID=307507 RepID=A0A2V0NM80_9CHLO|nr:hypothetical protein Rsub_00203 [Raphidocelis subcapitata]|eukprot:GBF87492.1 hypothetical protein Rsub_00203 [Raphidocelis subcapitata]